MNYKNHYEKLIDRARNRQLNSYKEKHHVVPKCVGGADSHENIVELTPEEHYVAHQLLIKIYPKEYKLVLAVLRMSGKGNSYRKCNNKLFGWLRRKVKEEKVVSDDTRRKMSESAKNQSEEKKQAISDKLKGRTSPNKGNRYEFTEEQRDKMKNRPNSCPNLGKTFSDETKHKMSLAKKGKPKSEEHKINMRIAQQRRRNKDGN
jgi:hypothetical protein